MYKIFLFAVIFIVFVCISTWATIINIPDDYPTIQQGIDASNDGDTVLVQPETYVENINFNGHNIVLGSLFLTTGDTTYISTTIIDGNSAGTVVKFINGEDSTAVITGFTIQNASGDLTGGILVAMASCPIINYNIISENISRYNGGGIRSEVNSRPTIINNIISENRSDYEGAGIFCLWNENVTIMNNIISGNASGSYGGGIAIYYSDNIIIQNNTITRNSSHYRGSGISVVSSDVIITNNIFWNNEDSEIETEQSCVTVTYCDIQGGWEGEGNIDCDPWFCYPDTGNFYLAENSCCVGAGCDSLGNPDSTINIGAFGIGCGEHSDISEELYTLPIRFSLSQNYPNPFNINTIITSTLPKTQFVTLKVYDLLGREVQTLMNEQKQAGIHVIGFDASELSSGIYFYRLQAGEFAESKKMTIIK